MSEMVLRSVLEDGIALLTINRESRRNALNMDVLSELIAHLTDIKSDEHARVVVLTGAGEKAFCAGGDLSPGQASGGMLAMHHQRQQFVELFHTLRHLGKPVIARVNGHCLAGGLGLMLGCDLAIASDNATFGTPEIKVGLWPMMIMSVIFRTIGRRRAMEMILTGERMDAQEAKDIGLINHVVPVDELDNAVAELAKKLAGFSPAILRLGRDAFYAQEDMPMDKALPFLQSQLTLNTLAEDAAEGIMAFFGKRKPEWKGR